MLFVRAAIIKKIAPILFGHAFNEDNVRYLPDPFPDHFRREHRLVAARQQTTGIAWTE